jgi:hypothetical protein
MIIFWQAGISWWDTETSLPAGIGGFSMTFSVNLSDCIADVLKTEL